MKSLKECRKWSQCSCTIVAQPDPSRALDRVWSILGIMSQRLQCRLPTFKQMPTNLHLDSSIARLASSFDRLFNRWQLRMRKVGEYVVAQLHDTQHQSISLQCHVKDPKLTPANEGLNNEPWPSMMSHSWSVKIGANRFNRAGNEIRDHSINRNPATFNQYTCLPCRFNRADVPASFKRSPTRIMRTFCRLSNRFRP